MCIAPAPDEQTRFMLLQMETPRPNEGRSPAKSAQCLLLRLVTLIQACVSHALSAHLACTAWRVPW